MYQFFQKYQEIIRYLIVGLLTTIVSLGTYYLCVETFLNPKSAIELQIANLLSWICAVSFAYITNRIYVFKSQNKHILKELSLFFTARIGSLVLDMGIMFITVTILGIDDKIAKLFVQVIVTITNYILSKIFVFHQNTKV